MSNRMYKQFGGQQNNMDQMIKQIKSIQNTFKGDPNERLNNIIKSGKIPQGILNQAQQKAKPIYELMKSLM